MKVTYEFDLNDPEKNDAYELKLHQHAHNMYSALTDINELMRSIRKGWKKPNLEELMNEITEYLIDSKIDDIY